jgi:choline dehydrogenase-like flavoprotein
MGSRLVVCGAGALSRSWRANAAVAEVGDDELAPWYQAFREAAGDDAIVHVVNAVGAVRWNAAFAYLDPSRGRTNLTILADTLVDKVLTKDGTATGALAAGASSPPTRSSSRRLVRLAGGSPPQRDRAGG